MRRSIALIAAAALALTLAPFGVAHAQQAQQVPPPSIVINAPAAGAYAGTVAVDVDVRLPNESPDSISSVTVDLHQVGVTNPIGRFCSDSYVAPSPDNQFARKTAVDVVFKWNSARIPGATGSGACDDGSSPTIPGGGDLTANNKYRIKVIVSTHGVGGQNPVTVDQSTGDLKINNEPAKPTGVKLSYDKGAGNIKVEWSKNAEPDVADYRIQECVVDKSSKPCGGGDWKPLSDVRNASSALVKVAGPAIYRYRVAALRPDADGATMVSDWATPQSEPTEIEVKEDPPETTTTQPKVEGTQTTAPQTPKTVVREVPTRRVQRGAPQVVQRIVEEEPGYNTELPYDGSSEEAISGLPIDDAGEGEGQRAILIPLAGGALLLVFAMQVHYLNRRASRNLEAVAVGGDDSPLARFDDWKL